MSYTPRNAATKGPIPSGFCEVGSCGYCRKGDCPCSCHTKTSGARVNVADTAVPHEAVPGSKAGTEGALLDSRPGQPAPASDIKPGLHFDLDERIYHSHPTSLSVSGAKKLLPPSCPAKFKAARDAGEEHSDAFDFGKCAHKLILGKGTEIAVAPFEDWRTKAAREFKAEAHAEGKSPILALDYAKAKALADSVAAHPLASVLFSGGEAEVSAFWTDPETGVECRARFDYLPEVVDGKRLVVPDLKTAFSAHPVEFGRAAAKFHYAMQDAWYTDACRAVGLDPDPAFVFVTVEKEAPYIVTVGQLRSEDKRLGRGLNDKARRIYRECVRTGQWPTYASPNEVAEIRLPAWHINEYEEWLQS